MPGAMDKARRRPPVPSAAGTDRRDDNGGRLIDPAAYSDGDLPPPVLAANRCSHPARNQRMEMTLLIRGDCSQFSSCTSSANVRQARDRVRGAGGHFHTRKI